MSEIETTPQFVQSVYQNLERSLAVIRGHLDRPLTYAEKVLLGHLADPSMAVTDKTLAQALQSTERSRLATSE